MTTLLIWQVLTMNYKSESKPTICWHFESSRNVNCFMLLINDCLFYVRAEMSRQADVKFFKVKFKKVMLISSYCRRLCQPYGALQDIMQTQH
ncbi:hypothetical protein PR048_023364 [Dryococelus australis]|uniref:Uncharacterized protein n=1 Tax=Dryococelus australis TaxID=614101 RepID=A0ABQ9GU14_9NEOP|nr:hypothetical protein PR048_023364 [Dryococelus australis]